MLIEKNVVFVKNFQFSDVVDLHILLCPEHDFIIFRKHLSVCVVMTKISGKCNSKTNA